MTQPARRFDIWRRLYRRFAIEPYPPGLEVPAVATVITPVTDADELLRSYGHFSASTASFDADGVQTALVVPSGKRMRFFALSAFRSSGDRSIIRWILTDASAGINFVLDTFAATNENYLRLEQPFILEEGDSVNIQSSGGAAATVYLVRSWVSEEDAF